MSTHCCGARKPLWGQPARTRRRAAGRAEKRHRRRAVDSDITPRGDYANADPVTGQAAWFDLRVRITKAADTGVSMSEPQFAPLELGQADDRPLRYGAQFRRKRSE